jgi:5-methylcytosine-specific restriction endonuclease McrA
MVTLDHLVPRNPLVAHGNGGNESTNLVTACKSCNSSRGDRPWLDYATGGARDRIETRRNQFVNLPLAKALIEGTAGDAEVEALR